MNFENQIIEGVVKITFSPIADNRGKFNRLFCLDELNKQNINFNITQINESFTNQKGSFRGVHYQFGAFAEYKLVRCNKGSILDFAVDLRKNSKTLFKNISIELTEHNNTALLLPPGVGHAFQTLEDNCSLIYLHSSYYKKEFEGGFRHNDAKINLHLPLPIQDISERDLNHPLIPESFTGINYEL